MRRDKDIRDAQRIGEGGGSGGVVVRRKAGGREVCGLRLVWLVVVVVEVEVVWVVMRARLAGCHGDCMGVGFAAFIRASATPAFQVCRISDCRAHIKRR